MPKPVVITADSTCDLPQELKERYDIRTIPLTILLGDESYLDGVGFTAQDIYTRYHEDGTLPKTSAPLASEGAECRDRGMSAGEIAQHLRTLTEKVDTSFVLDTLEFMWKGGRCSAVSALGANLLRLKPALEMKDGKLSIYKKYRGSIQSVYRQYVKERLASAEICPGHIFLTDSGEVPEETLRELLDIIREAVPGAEVHSAKAGCTITSHCGPKTLGVLFIRK